MEGRGYTFQNERLEQAKRTTQRGTGNYGMYKESQEGYCAWFLEVDLRELAVAELEKTLGQTMKRPE